MSEDLATTPLELLFALVFSPAALGILFGLWYLATRVAQFGSYSNGGLHRLDKRKQERRRRRIT